MGWYQQGPPCRSYQKAAPPQPRPEPQIRRSTWGTGAPGFPEVLGQASGEGGAPQLPEQGEQKMQVVGQDPSLVLGGRQHPTKPRPQREVLVPE